jgi:hypothetical protein
MFKFYKNCIKSFNILYLLPIFFIFLSIYGGFNFSSPVPVEDYWDQIIDFFNKIEKENYSVWFAQHNEHRIIIARIFYFIYLKLFPNHSWVLIFLNYILFFVLAFFLITLKKSLYSSIDYKFSIYINTIIFSSVFFWSQSLNFIFEVQNQAILAQLIPLLSFFFFFKYSNTKDIKYLFIFFILTIISPFTMISGLFVIPILLIIYRLFNLDVKYVLFLIVLFILLLSIYFFNYNQPVNHASVFENIVKYNYKIILFFFMYLGSFFHFLLGKSLFSSYIAFLFGVGFLVLFIYKLKFDLDNKINTNFIFYSFGIYVLIIAMLTSLGRINLGLEKAFSGRYSTPVILGWLSLMFIYLPELNNFFLKKRNKFNLIYIIFICLMSIYQLTAFKNFNQKFSQRQLGLLSLSLGVEDSKTEYKLYPEINHLRNIANEAKENNYDIFSNKKFTDIKNLEKYITNKDFKSLNSKQYNKINTQNEWYLINLNIHNNSHIYILYSGDKKTIVGRAILLKNGSIQGYVSEDPRYYISL